MRSWNYKVVQRHFLIVGTTPLLSPVSYHGVSRLASGRVMQGFASESTPALSCKSFPSQKRLINKLSRNLLRTRVLQVQVIVDVPSPTIAEKIKRGYRRVPHGRRLCSHSRAPHATTPPAILFCQDSATPSKISLFPCVLPRKRSPRQSLPIDQLSRPQQEKHHETGGLQRGSTRTSGEA